MKAEDIHIDYETALTVLPPPHKTKGRVFCTTNPKGRAVSHQL